MFTNFDAPPVLILAGGKATRLSSEQTTLPKTLTKVGGESILLHIIRNFTIFGIRKFFVLGGYKILMISQFLEKIAQDKKDSNNKDFLTYIIILDGVEINVSLINSGEDTQTGGRILFAQNFISDLGPFFVTYGDGLANINFKEEFNFHLSHGKVCTVAAVVPPSRFAKIELNGNQVIRFQEKFDSVQMRISGGFFIFNQRIFEYLSGPDDILEETPLVKLASEGELMAFIHDKFWQCIDTPRDVVVMNDFAKQKPAPWMDYS
jgi:glucose-1-phosphate cytidylyltransferase